MPFCGRCGNELTDTQAFCPSCGAPVRRASAPQQTTAGYAQQPASGYGQQQSAGYAQQPTSGYAQSPAPGYGQTVRTGASPVQPGSNPTQPTARPMQTGTRPAQSSPISFTGPTSGGGFVGKMLNAHDKLGNLKVPFWVTLGLLILNLILSAVDMIKADFWITERSESFYGWMRYIKDSGFAEETDADVFLPLLTICTILTVLSIVLMVLPIVLGKAYDRKYLILNYVAMIATFLLYLVLVIAYSDDEYSEVINILFGAYLYLIETLAALVATILFSGKIKKNSQTFNAVQYTG